MTHSRTLVALPLAVLLALAALAFADPTEPTQADRTIAIDVCAIVQEGHLLHQPVDDVISRRMYSRFLESFDPSKMYFLQADIAEFSPFVIELDDQLPTGDLEFMSRVFTRYLKRFDQCVEWAAELLQAPHDFTQPGRVILDADAAAWAQDEGALRDRWEGRIKYELLNLIIDGVAEAEARQRIEKRYRMIAKERHQMRNDEVLETYLNALAASYDPHSQYMSPSTLEDFNISLQLSLEGIGASLTSEDGVCTVREVIPGGAADRDGRFKPGDRIVGVGQGETGEILDVVEMRLRDLVRMIRGKAGTVVRIEVMPAKSTKREIYTLTRAKVELTNRGARGEVVEVPGGPEGRPCKLGVVNLPSFYAAEDAYEAPRARKGQPQPAVKTATEDVRAILKDFQAKGVDGVVVDLRWNGGGLLQESIGVAGLFVDEGPIVQVKDNRRIQIDRDEEPGVAWDGPLVVLVSRLTASASEIVAGAIQDYGRGLIVGDTHTHGKGTVQRIFDLTELLPSQHGDNLGAIKLTLQKFYRPNGESTQLRGVISDLVLPAWTDHDDFGEANLPHAMEFDRIASSRFTPMGTVPPETVRTLRERSQARKAEDEGLLKLAERARKLHEWRARKVLTFTEASLREDLKQFADDEKKIEQATDEDAKREAFGHDAYEREVLQIACDLIRLAPARNGGK